VNQEISVLHVAQPTEAGVAAVVLQLIRDQMDRGWAVRLACPDDGWLGDRARAVGVSTIAWPASRSPGAGTLVEVQRLTTIVGRVVPDVVHLHSSKAGLAGRLAIRNRKPVIFQPHMWSFLATTGAMHRFATMWERFAVRWTDLLLCVSDDEAEMGARARISGHVAVVPNGVNADYFAPRSRDGARRRLGLAAAPTVVCVGRLAVQKGQDQLLSAWSDVLRQVPEARLVIVGDGPMAEVWQRGHPMGAHPSVTWLGNLEDPRDGYAAADVVVLPSRSEAMALVPLEAMASGRPVVAFDVAGAAESLGRIGAVVRQGQLGQLADALAERLIDTNLATAEGEIGRERILELFDGQRAASKIADITTELVCARRSRT
jgi:glycosyltransferase involved in cell wall biosynthesis